MVAEHHAQTCPDDTKTPHYLPFPEFLRKTRPDMQHGIGPLTTLLRDPD
jgi:hypothetical protein